MKNKLSRFAVPYEVWMAIFVVAPIVIMVAYAFSSADGGFTLDNFVQMGGYTEVFLRSFKLAIIATVICLLIGYPVSYLMSREGASFQRTAMVLIMLPMWMNFLLRTYSWMTILENNGLLNQLFQKIGLISLYNHIFGTNLEYFSMMNTQGAVVLGMVYNYLPFMILPIYSVIIKLDHSLLDVVGTDDTMLSDLQDREEQLLLRRLVRDCLTEREADIIRRRYGLEGHPPQTQRQVAAVYGISRSYVSRIEKRALEKLEKELRKG